MNHLRSILSCGLVIGLFGGLLVLPGLAHGQGAPEKLSPRLRMLTNGNPELVESAKRHLRLKTGPDYPEPMVDTLVRMQGDPRVLEAYGARLRSVLGDVATVDIPISALGTIAGHPDVIRIEEARKLKPRLDVSVPASGANGVWGGSTLRPLAPPWTGNTGKNVIVGLVDTGIDLKHGDFKDSLGRSRLLYVLDQNTGQECTKQQIDAGSCKEKDLDGHGTHVLGTAAGNGAATGGGKPAYRYIGMAPEANLIVVNTDFSDTGILDGITYIETKSAALGLPVVINLSLGGHFGPHDGTSNFEAAMDAASGAGKVVVVAAGNEADDKIHASGTVVNNASGPTVTFNVPIGSTDVVLDLWYPGADQMGVQVSSPSATCTTSGFRYPGDADLVSNTACGRVTISTPGINSANGDHEIVIALQNIGHAIMGGHWTFTLTGSGCASPPCITDGAFDVWVDDVASSATFVDHIDTAKTVGMPATATQAIAVGGYVTKTVWTSSNGPATDTLGTVGEITFFSSLGPRRSCSAGNAICTATVQKPELAAPGEEIMSSHASGTSTAVCFAASTRCLDPDGQHIVMQGTSMATPHVTGAAALLLAQDQTLTADQVRTALEHAQTDGFTGAAPNDTWGYGKLAVDLAAASVVGSNAPPAHAPVVPTGVTATAGSGSATISWDAIANHIYFDGYNVYQSTASGGPYTKIASVLTTTSLKVTKLKGKTPYYFVVTSDDTPGLESGYSIEATATPTASSGGGGCGSVGPIGPSNLASAMVFLLSLFLPLLFVRVRGRIRLSS
jgi:subtilisin family serine protease